MLSEFPINFAEVLLYHHYPSPAKSGSCFWGNDHKVALGRCEIVTLFLFDETDNECNSTLRVLTAMATACNAAVYRKSRRSPIDGEWGTWQG